MVPMLSTVLAPERAPLYWRRTFPGDPRQARAVRRFAAALLADLRCLDDVLLAADELVANALRHTKSGGLGGAFVVEICVGEGVVRLAVSDEGGPSEPVPGEADELAESGRGLRMVALLATCWGWYGNDVGRTVHAEFRA
jgi:anti-sigma regulatory factor (Ser/Thr protein kinase)